MPSPRSQRRLATELGKLSSPRARAVVVAVAVLLCAPVLVGNLALDDHILLDQLLGRASGEGAGRGPLDLFVFADGDPARNARLMDAGAGLPWWTYEGVKGAFLRPLASVTHALDARLWPRAPSLMLAHNLLWLAALLAIAARLYGDVTGVPWVAGVATALYALDAAHAQTAGWVANRNALIAGAFALLCLLAHHRHRREGARWGAIASPLALLAGLLAGELAIGVLGYLGAYALFMDGGPWRRRALALAPHAAVVVTWRAAYASLGYGAQGLGTYLDPLGAPGDFVAELPRRWAALTAGQVAGPPPDLFALVPPSAQSALLAVAAAVVGLFAWLAWPTLRARQEARFFVVGAALSAVPACATWPSARLLLLVGVGAAGLVAHVAHDVLHAPAAARAHRLRVAGVTALLALGLVVAPLQRPARVLLMSAVGQVAERASAGLPEDLAGRTVILAHVPSSLHAAYVQVLRASRGEPRPDHLHWLAATGADVHIRRLDARTLRVQPEGGFLASLMERHYRDPQHPMPVGHRVRLAAMTVDVVRATADGRPSVCDFRFEEPLESARYVLRRWRGDGVVPWEPPPVGAQATLSLSPGARHGEQKLGRPGREGHEGGAQQARHQQEQPVPPRRVAQPEGLVEARAHVEGQPEALDPHQLEAALVEQVPEGVRLEEHKVPRHVQVPPGVAEDARRPAGGVGDLDGHVAARLEHAAGLLEHRPRVGLVLEVFSHGDHVHAARLEPHVGEGASLDAHAELALDPVGHLLLEIHADALGPARAADPVEQAVDAAAHVDDARVRGEAPRGALEVTQALQADAAGEPPQERPQQARHLGGQRVGEVVVGVVCAEGLGHGAGVHVHQRALGAPHEGVLARPAEQAVARHHGGVRAALAAGGAPHLLLQLGVGEARELSNDGGHGALRRWRLRCIGEARAVASRLGGADAC
jgi:hypothetical protein